MNVFFRKPCASSLTKILVPFQMALLSSDFSQLPPVGIMDILNHLIMSSTDYNKSMLSSRRSFKKSTIYVRMAMFRALE